MEKQEPSTQEKKAVNTMCRKGKRFTLEVEYFLRVKNHHARVSEVHPVRLVQKNHRQNIIIPINLRNLQ
jgi:hypothetical protein